MADIPVELLRRAWPDGYLAKRGVYTRDEWTCLSVYPGEAEALTEWGSSGGTTVPIPYYEHEPDLYEVNTLSRAQADADLQAGAFLPSVDPADTATWACLLADLAEAVERRTSYRFAIDRGLIFNLHPTRTTGAVLEGWGAKFEWDIHPTRDVALALVLCRIFEREQGQ